MLPKLRKGKAPMLDAADPLLDDAEDKREAMAGKPPTRAEERREDKPKKQVRRAK